MPGFRSVVCPVDFSDHSVRALRYAVGLAGHDRASLTVVTVKDPLLVDAAAAAAVPADYVAKKAEKELRALIANVLPAGATWVPVPEVAIRTGTPEAEILDCASERSADLIVMGTHGLNGYRKMFFGSVTERVLRKTSIPVLAVPLTDRAIITLSEQQPIIRIGVVMVPVDLGPFSEKQVRTAAMLAQHFGASLLLVHVLQQAADEHEHLAIARERLVRLASGTGATVSVDTHVVHGQPSDEIGRLASQQEVGLIVMGLTGEGSTSGRPGSVAYRVLTLAPVPVLALV